MPSLRPPSNRAYAAPTPHLSNTALLPSPFSRVGSFGRGRVHIAPSQWVIIGSIIAQAPPPPPRPSVNGSIIEA